MKIGQLKLNEESRLVVIDGENIYQNSQNQSPNTVDIIKNLKNKSLSEEIKNLIKSNKIVKISDDKDYLNKKKYTPTKPVYPNEAWAAGVTYKKQALEHDKDLKKKGKETDLYYYVYKNERVEIFFKGTNRTLVGSNEKLMLRSDSNLIMPEAELVLIIGPNEYPIAYTLGNDLTAWDIESECPLYLSQAKIWQGSGSIGPWMVPVEEFDDAYNFEIKCLVKRNNSLLIESTGNTSELKRSIEELCYYMNLSNKVSPGSVLFTGTACILDHNVGLKEGDEVKIISNKIGELTNKIHLHSHQDKKYVKRDNK